MLLDHGSAGYGVGEPFDETTTFTREGMEGGQRLERQADERGEAAEKSNFFLQSWKECHRLRVQLDKQRGSKLQAI